MKKQIFLLLFSTAAVFAFGQTKQIQYKGKINTISITDIRDHGISKPDMSTNGRKDGDVAVVRFLQVVPSRTSQKLDTAAMYEIYFYKTYNSVTEKGKSWLQAYNVGVRDENDFDKVSYQWTPGDILSVTLFNSATNSKRNIKLKASGQQAAVVQKDSEKE